MLIIVRKNYANFLYLMFTTCLINIYNNKNLNILLPYSLLILLDNNLPRKK